jgi:hypothetical protein
VRRKVISNKVYYLTGDSLAAWKEMATMDKRTVLKLTPTHIRAMGFPQK